MMRKKPLVRRQSKLHELCRIFLSFIICQSIGSIFYFICALKYNVYSKVLGTVVSIIVQFVNCLIIFSPKVRAIVFISIPNLLTSRIRALILVIIFTWAIQSSANNITNNIKSTADGVICVQERVRYLATEFKESTDKNLRRIPIEKLKLFLRRATQPFDRIRKKLRDIDDSLTNMLSWQRSLFLKFKEFFSDCSTFAQAPFHACVKSVRVFHNNCLNSLHSIICSPIHLLKHICYLSKILELSCEWPKMLKNYLEEGVNHFVKKSKRRAIQYAQETMFYSMYSKAKGAKKSFESIEISLNHTLTIEQKVNIRLNEFRRRLYKEIGFIEFAFSLATYISNIFFGVILILPFLYAFFYIKDFNVNTKYDNYYITNELIKINKQQKLKKFSTIFPLDIAEKKLYVCWYSLRIVKSEISRLFFSITLSFLSIGVPVVLITYDILIYKVLNRSYEFFHNNNTRITKPNIYSLKVTGEGFMSTLFSNILNTFEPLNDNTEKRDSMWHSCFIEPAPPNYKLFKFIALLFVFCILLCFIEVYSKRLRHKIANCFFKHRVKIRAIDLYNKILENRFAKMNAEAKLLLKENQLLVKKDIMSSSSSLSSLLSTIST